MNSIILAAGEGKRLRPLTKKIPKCLISFSDKPILYRQIDTLKKFNPKKITVIAGYLHKKIKYQDIETIYNQNYISTNMVYTLFCAEKQMNNEEDVIITYGDILYEDKVIRKLLDVKGDIVVCVNRKWRKLWEMRMENPLDDAETLKIKDINKIVEIGKKTNTFSDIEGQYMGIIKLSYKFVDKFKAFWQDLNKNKIYSVEYLNNLYLTDYIQMMIERGYNVRACFIDGGWIEIDTINDLELYTKLLKAGKLESLMKL